MRHAVAADARGFRLDHAERERHGDRRVDDVAAALERERAGARGQRMAGDDDRAIGDDERLDQRLIRDHRVDGRLELRLVLCRGGVRPILSLSCRHAPAAGPDE